MRGTVMVLDEVTCAGSRRAPREGMGCLTDCTAQMGKSGKTETC